MMSFNVLCKSSILDTGVLCFWQKLFGWIAVTEWNSACGDERCENSLYLVLNKRLITTCIDNQETMSVFSQGHNKRL